MSPSEKLCRRFGIRLPIVQAPIGRVASPELASAVTRAGGLGQLACTWDSPDDLRARIDATRALAKGPFAVNFVLDFPIEEKLALALDRGVPVVSFFWGVSEEHIARVHLAGGLALQTVGSVNEAILAAKAGADAIVAQGYEAGGHVRSNVSTFILVPRVVDAVGDIPVLAAGGIADARGVRAALALGAAGVWVGTRFLASTEADIHPVYQERIVSASEEDTVYSELFDIGWPNAPLRTLRNSTVRAWEEAGRPLSPHRPGEGQIIGKRASGADMLRYDFGSPTRLATGETEAMAHYAGQGVGLVRAVRSAADIVEELAAGLATS
ncbi:NAD(P)H-dependent flavin oxidoreductase [Pendulispora albinea]|uniref:Nitronate monooxygenase n=1 Tax=Pendulispora albinea TaxID=2741071 RepID=A0ABZ2M488_9BACT